MGWRKVAVVAVMMSLVAAACGGNEAATDDAATVAGTAGADSSSPDITVVTGERLFTPWTMSIAASLVEQLGSEDAALDALFLSINKGYSAPQIRQALEDTDLQVDGSIAGVDPSLEPLNMILQPAPDGDGEGALGSDDAPLILAFFQDAPLPIDALRESARVRGAASASQDEVGALGVLFIVQLLEDGFGAGDIIEIILFGAQPVDGPYSLPGTCSVRAFFVTNEFICPGGQRYDENLAGFGQPTDPEAEGESAISEPEGEEEEPADGDVVAWSGEITPLIPDAIEPAVGILRVTRNAGTGEFEADFSLEYRSPFGVACTWVHAYSFEAQSVGTTLELPDEIFFTGESVDSHIKTDCTAEWADLAGGPTNKRQDSVRVRLTEQGIAGTWHLGIVGETDFFLAPDG